MRDSLVPSGRLRAAATTTDLYRACMQLSEEARSLQLENEGMKRLGLNAQVLAVQTGNRGSALEVIVAEIGRLSASIREVLTLLGRSAKELSSTAIELLHLSHLSGSYALAREVGVEPGSAGRFDATVGKVQGSMEERLAEIARGLAEVEALIQDLSRIAQQIPPVTTMIRIVVSEIGTHGDALAGTVEDLRGFHGNLDAKVERMRAILSTANRRSLELRREAT